MFLTTVFAMYPWMAWPQWDKVWRIMLMTFVTMIVINERERVHWLVVVIALSLAFYGVKGVFSYSPGAPATTSADPTARSSTTATRSGSP